MDMLNAVFAGLRIRLREKVAKCSRVVKEVELRSKQSGRVFFSLGTCLNAAPHIHSLRGRVSVWVPPVPRRPPGYCRQVIRRIVRGVPTALFSENFSKYFTRILP